MGTMVGDIDELFCDVSKEISCYIFGELDSVYVVCVMVNVLDTCVSGFNLSGVISYVEFVSHDVSDGVSDGELCGELCGDVIWNF